MATDTTKAPRPTIWIVISALLSLAAIAILWPLQYLGQVCVLIYPAPPGCGADEPRWVPLIAIGLVIALLAASVVVYATVSNARTALILLAAAIVVVVMLAAAIVWLSQTGMWDPYQPPVSIE